MESGGFSNDQIGRLFGVSYSAVSHAVRSFKIKMTDHPQLLETVNDTYSQSKL
jgi:predicted transcriptional regulator